VPAGVAAMWSTPAGIRALLPGNKESVLISPKGAFPNIVALPNGQKLGAWEDDGAVQIQKLDRSTGEKGTHSR
jgi:hypothetical protein